MPCHRFPSSASLRAALLAAALCLAAAAPAARAMVDDSRYTLTEMVGFAFSHLADVTPDFALWIKTPAAYSELSEEEQLDIYSSEEARLQKGFYNFHPGEDLLRISVPVDLTSQGIVKQSRKAREAGITRLATLTPSDLPGFYFPYKVGDMWVAVVPNDIESFVRFYMTDDDYNKFVRKFSLHASGATQIHMKGRADFLLRPTTVDFENQIDLDGEKMWLMLAEVAEMNFIADDSKKTVVWEYQAPWYVTYDSKELLDLYDR